MTETTQETSYRPCDARELVAQIGRGNILAISGGRVLARETGVTLPVGHGYSVTIDVAADDTYTVSRVFKRSGKVFNKGQMTGIYCEDIGDVAYYASCYVNVDFPLKGV